ncbi:hypothetical protein, partial [Streptomyces sp. NPDC052127]|uniref:hypothetical protein n=1 Tax=Streptomyces sp. NPDC052127 TaxID=3155679 RepID=UPI0034154A35
MELPQEVEQFLLRGSQCRGPAPWVGAVQVCALAEQLSDPVLRDTEFPGPVMSETQVTADRPGTAPPAANSVDRY